MTKLSSLAIYNTNPANDRVVLEHLYDAKVLADLFLAKKSNDNLKYLYQQALSDIGKLIRTYKANEYFLDNKIYHNHYKLHAFTIDFENIIKALHVLEDYTEGDNAKAVYIIEGYVNEAMRIFKEWFDFELDQFKEYQERQGL